MKYMNVFNRLITTHGADIWRHAEQWTTDLTQPGEIKRKMEQRKGLQLQTSCKLDERVICQNAYFGPLKYAPSDLESLSSLLVVTSAARLANYFTSYTFPNNFRMVSVACLASTGHPRIPRCHNLASLARGRGPISSSAHSLILSNPESRTEMITC
jgi:hypothetical protein